MTIAEERCKYLIENVIDPEFICSGKEALSLLKQFNPIFNRVYQLEKLRRQDPKDLEIIRRIVYGK